MATASRPQSGAYTTLFTHVLEDWWNGKMAEDVVFSNVPALYILSKTSKKSKPLPKYINVRIMDKKAVGVDSFGGYDSVQTDPSEGAHAASFTVANYVGPITMSQEEEWEFTSPTAIADRIQEYVEQLFLTMSDRISKDVYKGNVVNTKNILGFEQALFAETHITDGGSAATTATYLSDPWQARQHTNIFGGIQRVAFTGVETGGTGWEGITIDGSDAVAGTTSAFIGYSSGDPNSFLKLLHQTYDFACWGATCPNLGLWGGRPYDDYEFAAQSKTQIRKEASAFGDVQLGYDNLKYKNAVIIKDRFSNTQNASSYSDAVFGSPNMYFINTKFVDLAVDSRADFKLRKPKEPVNQLAAVRHMVWRGQMIFKNPRYHSRYFNYGLA